MKTALKYTLRIAVGVVAGHLLWVGLGMLIVETGSALVGIIALVVLVSSWILVEMGGTKS